ncbi:MAG: SdpI family protein [Chloroflexi bacterium]|nr:SdpI family protein [Chloroflexota bacterium]MQC25771.1 SdpI family protein [Chloroflexota bacterium]
MSGLQVALLILALYGLLFMVLGYAMPRLEPNRGTGIRNRATLADERVWRETHRRYGPAFSRYGAAVLISGLMFLMLPLPDIAAVGMHLGLIVAGFAWLRWGSSRYARRRLAYHQQQDAAAE